MDKQAVQKENEHPKMDSIDNTDDQLELWETVPVEIWVKIFEFVGCQEQSWHWHEKNKDLAKLRNVCKKWTNMVDENIYFFILFNDRVLKEKTTNHLRLKRCSFDNFTVHPPSHPTLFREPGLLTDVAIQGNITRANLIWLVSQLPNWNCLRLGEKFFECDDIFIPSHDSDEDSILSNYWSHLKHLHLECMHPNFRDKRMAKALSNLQKFLSMKLGKLRHFLFGVTWNAELFRLSINFLLLNRNVNSVDISCIRADGKISSEKVHQFDPEDFRRIQLKTLKLAIFHLSPNECCAFLPLIKAQKSLNSLEVQDTCAFHTTSNSLCFGDTLEEIVRNNYSSLTCLNLFVRYVAGLVDAKMFQQMPFLKTLILKAEDGPPISHIVNLACLPASIETLDLQCFNCSVQDLLDLCIMNKLVNMKRLRFYPCTGETLITPDALDSLILETKLRDLKLGSIVLDIFEYETKQNAEEYENKTFLTTTKGFIVPVAEVWYKNGYGIVDIIFDCKSLENMRNINLECIKSN